MKLFDKGTPLTIEYCTLCKKEIEPGEKIIISTICPSHARQLSNRMYNPTMYSYIDNAQEFHEKCYNDQIKNK